MTPDQELIIELLERIEGLRRELNLKHQKTKIAQVIKQKKEYSIVLQIHDILYTDKGLIIRVIE